jgi:hypothetical protein
VRAIAASVRARARARQRTGENGGERHDAPEEVNGGTAATDAAASAICWLRRAASTAATALRQRRDASAAEKRRRHSARRLERAICKKRLCGLCRKSARRPKSRRLGLAHSPPRVGRRQAGATAGAAQRFIAAQHAGVHHSFFICRHVSGFVEPALGRQA